VLVRTLLIIPFMFSFHFSHIILIQEEKLEPLKNTTDDPRIRLLNLLYAKKKERAKRTWEVKGTTMFSLYLILQHTPLSNVVFISKC